MSTVPSPDTPTPGQGLSAATSDLIESVTELIRVRRRAADDERAITEIRAWDRLVLARDAAADARLAADLAASGPNNQDEVRLTEDEVAELDAPIYCDDLDMHQRSDSVRAVVERILAARLVASRDTQAPDALAKVRALAERWRREADERGPMDTLYTGGVADMLFNALGSATDQDQP